MNEMKFMLLLQGLLIGGVKFKLNKSQLGHDKCVVLFTDIKRDAMRRYRIILDSIYILYYVYTIIIERRVYQSDQDSFQESL